ncbi:hypothetical protein RB3684 [Rhodopirellula baltica SH 1]|uniref:Uncharacterized protein n=1 Tax=Rhodopirellula baltica (strain DSM 10527 / NCIMB 13988 / SH1) TaxID=243090 RepID=Q7UTT9_RHOBA|nr:hypothetical protein RB3684 [Rhodopirellula baltica SH 1]
MLSGFLVGRAVVPSAGLLHRRKLCDDGAFDFWSLQRYMRTIRGQRLNLPRESRGWFSSNHMRNSA